MFITLFAILFPVMVLAQNLEIPILLDWERRDKIFGSEAIFSQKSDSGNMIVFQKVETKITAANLQTEYNRIIEQRKTSGPKPWSNVQIEYKEKLNWQRGKTEILIVSYNQNTSRFYSVITLYPLERNYILGYGKFTSMELKEIKSRILPFFQAIKLNP